LILSDRERYLAWAFASAHVGSCFMV